MGAVGNETWFLEYDHVLELVGRGPSDQGILSITIDSPPERRHEGDFWRPVLNSGLTGLAQKHPDDKRLEQAIDAAVKELLGLERDARYRSIAYFRSVDPEWSWWRSLQGSIETQFVWGRRPAVFPLISYLHREPCVGVILAAQEEVQYFTWRQSVLEEGEHWELDLDTEDWRYYAGRAYPQPMRAQQTATHDEHFRRRFMELVRKEFAALAPRVDEAGAKHRWEALIVFGAAEIRDVFVDALSDSWRKKLIETPERRFPTVDLKELSEAVSQEVAAWRERTSREEMRTLLDNLGGNKRGVVGDQEVLDLLSNDRVHRLYVCEKLQGPGYRRRDGSMSVVAGLSPLRLRVTRKQLRDYTLEPNFLEEVIALAVNRRVEIVPMHGTCAERLRGLGGLGAWLRY